MKKRRTIAPVCLLLSSLPFYFIGFFTVSQNGNKVLSSIGFWRIGITGQYGGAQNYFNTRSPHFISGIIGALIFSLVLMLGYAVLQIIKASSTVDDKKYYSASFVLSSLCNCFYAGAFLCTALLYANAVHASYVHNGDARMGLGAFAAYLIQFIAMALSYFNFDEYVIVPLIKQRQAESAKENIVVPGAKNYSSLQSRHAYCSCAQQTGIGYDYVQKYYLVCCQGDLAGAKIELKNDLPVYIGRDPARCALVIDAKCLTVARIHCFVLRKGAAFYVNPFSVNGVFFSDTGTPMRRNEFNKVEPNKKFNLAKTENEYFFKIQNFRKDNE